ncbi:MAG: hypothetical protein IJH63_10365 [Methanobrevibacter sp.]|nr:hypothetical protein [Methanosphaera sp.]MBR0371103.1 hypothetical protein [Methanobrevibacter sp.]
MFRIVQRLDFDEVEDDYLDIIDWTVGYVDDEYFAQEFCNKYSCCSYEQVHITRYPLQLRGNLIEDVEECEIRRIPVRKWED